jgi:N-acetyl-gamma-glutamylphosphate reductase
VHKVGRTTGYTRGVIDDVSADVRVGYDGGEYLFVDQIVVRSTGTGEFSDSGDSGSLIVARPGCYSLARRALRSPIRSNSCCKRSE